MQADRRTFIRKSLTTAAGLAAVTLPAQAYGTVSRPLHTTGSRAPSRTGAPLIRFSAIGLNHGHIYGQVETVIRGGGELVSFYAKEPELIAAFSKRYPKAVLARAEKEILEDKSIQLVVSASIPADRAPLGIEVMRHGKDFMADKPGVISLDQLDKVRKVQKETKRIYSILYSERLENRASIEAGNLIKAGAIGKVVQTIGMGPHRINVKSRPEWFFRKEAYGGNYL